MKNCNHCPLNQTSFLQIESRGNCEEDCELLIIGDYPRAEDMQTGYPLTGNKYEFIWELLESIGVRYQMTYLLRCIPVDNRTRMYRKPTQEEYTTCVQKNLFQELERIKPKFLLFIGQSTIEALLGEDKKVNDYRDICHKWGEYEFLATYHPAFILMSDNSMLYDRFIDDLVYACRHAMKHRSEKKYRTITLSPDKFSRVVDLWCENDLIEYVGFDTESNTLDPHVEGAKITSFSVAVDNHTGYNLYLYHPEFPDITEEDRNNIISSAKKLLTKKKVVAHHSKHEYRLCKVLWRFTPNIVDDTMYMSYILYLAYPGIRHGLKYLSGRFLSLPPWEEYIDSYSSLFKRIMRRKTLSEDTISSLVEEYERIKVTREDIVRFNKIIRDPNYYIKQADSAESDVYYWMIPARILEEYAGMDAIAPLMLKDYMKPKIFSDEGLKKAYLRMMKGAEAFANMELKGLRIVDIERWTKIYEERLAQRLSEIREFEEVKEYELENNIEFNPSSTKQCADIFYDRFKFPVKQTTKKGAPSTSEVAIIEMIKEYREISGEENRVEFLEKFREYKKINKLLSAYLVGLRRFIKINRAFDGINSCDYVSVPEGEKDMHIFPQYKLHTVDTGRVASAEPSLHTIPAGSDIKRLFVSHWYGRGGIIVTADQSQLELRVLASIIEKFYGDSSLADAYRYGKDIHRFNACFTGDTKVRLLDGRNLTFEELSSEYGDSGESFWVYSVDDKDNIVPGLAHSPRMTKVSDELVEVTLDNGSKVRCTRDHLWRTRDGYTEAENLTPGTSITPLYVKEDRGYELYYDLSKKNFKYTHVMVTDSTQSDVSFSGMVRHHVDYNKRNNRPDNLRLMEWREHTELHQSNCKQLWSEEANISRSETMKEAYKLGISPQGNSTSRKEVVAEIGRKFLGKDGDFQTSPKYEESRKKVVEAGSASLRRNHADKEMRKLNGLKSSVTIKNNLKDIERRKQHLRDVSKNPISRMKGRTTTRNNILMKNRYTKYLRKVTPGWVSDIKTLAKIRGVSFEDYLRELKAFEQFVKLFNESSLYDFSSEVLDEVYYNHKVVSVERISGEFPVYDLTVDEYHNFAIYHEDGTGSFVHNSKVFNKAEEEIVDAERRFAKTISFSLLYGSSEKSVAESTGRTSQEVHNLFETFYSAFPGIKKYIEDTHEYARRYGCVRTPMGRIKYVLAAQHPEDRMRYSEALRQAQNGIIQSSGSDMSFQSIVYMNDYFREHQMNTKIVGFIHDSIELDTPPGEWFHSYDILKYSMKDLNEAESWINCPLQIDVEIGTSMGDTISVKEMEILEDNSRIFIFKGYDYIVKDILEESKFSYDILSDEIVKEEEFFNSTGDLIARKALSLSFDNKSFIVMTRKVHLKPKSWTHDYSCSFK